MRAIVARLVRVGAEVHRRRDAAKKAARGRCTIQFVDAPSEPERPSSSASCSIVLIAPPPFQGNYSHVTRQLQLQGFWTNIFLNPVVDMANDSGTTWLELLALFLLRGGCIVPEQVSHSHHHRPRLTYMFKQFVQHSKALLQFADLSSKQLATTISNRSRPLIPYGITSY